MIEHFSALIAFVSMVAAVIAAYISWDQAKKSRIRGSREDRENLLDHINNSVISTQGLDFRNQLVKALSYENHDDPRWESFPKNVTVIKQKIDLKLNDIQGWNNHSGNTGMSDLELLFHSLKQEMQKSIKDTYKTHE